MLPDVPVHVIQRGNNRSACFVTDEDRSFYLFHLSRYLSRSDCELHAYCLMTNHVHLLLTPKHHNSCGELMKSVGQLHSQYVNRTYRRTGTLWEGRFRSCLVQSEAYVLACYRYIELNPVRAGIVDTPTNFRWSSYPTNAFGEPNASITPHADYLRLGRTMEERRLSYIQFVASTANEFDEIRSATNGGYALGDESFRRRMAHALGRRVEKGRPGRPARTTQGDDAQGELSLQTPRNVVCP